MGLTFWFIDNSWRTTKLDLGNSLAAIFHTTIVDTIYHILILIVSQHVKYHCSIYVKARYEMSMRQRISSNAAMFFACNHKTTISLPHRNQELFNKPLSVIIGVKSHISRVKKAIVFYAMKNLGLRETNLKHVYSCAMHYILVTLVQGINGSRYLFIVQRFII